MTHKCFVGNNKIIPGEEGAIDVLLKVLDKYTKDDDICKLCCWVFYNISSNSNRINKLIIVNHLFLQLASKR